MDTSSVSSNVDNQCKTNKTPLSFRDKIIVLAYCEVIVRL